MGIKVKGRKDQRIREERAALQRVANADAEEIARLRSALAAMMADRDALRDSLQSALDRIPPVAEREVMAERVRKLEGALTEARALVRSGITLAVTFMCRNTETDMRAGLERIEAALSAPETAEPAAAPLTNTKEE